MSKIVSVLFPWRKTFKRLELEKRWWHRLAVVLFSLVLVVVLLYSWVIGDGAISPKNPFDGDIHHWAAATNGSGLLFDLDSFRPIDGDSNPAPQPAPSVVQKTVEMPDGATATYPRTASDKKIEADWQHKMNIATTKALMVGFFIAVIVTLAFSYLLQATYRALLYVIYGAQAGAIPDDPAG
ncbi:hypothetical protein [Granulicella sp. L46]|uniref:hypothetical protein n=1 Tax=Granulicella sp. L46 TaxID=1641865 RepID=UPI00131DCC97|nr:hypothetical protein [Granulicella sp. L46]